jgi:hypothetical protein
MAGPFTRQTVENWVADFVTSTAASAFEPVVREYAPEFLVPLLLAPCEAHDCEPGDLGEEELRAAFTGAVAAVPLPGSVRDRVPDVCAEFVADLEQQGRLAGGRTAGLALRAARRAYLDAAGAPRAPVRRPAPKLSPNEPCPCGSGRKYKKCCQA